MLCKSKNSCSDKHQPSVDLDRAKAFTLAKQPVEGKCEVFNKLLLRRFNTVSPPLLHPLSQPTPPRRLCRVKSFGCETKEEEGKEQLREQKMIEVGRQRRGEGECSPRDARELLRAKMGERDHTGEATGTSRLSSLNSTHQSQCEESGASPSGKHKHSDSLVAKPEELLSCGFPSPVSGSK